MRKSRRSFTPQQKAAILREHLVDRVAVSDLCDKHAIVPTLFYRWQKEMFENLPSLLERRRDSPGSALGRQNEQLRKKLAQKDEVIAEIMAELIAEKKRRGGL
jgi:transposase